MQAGLKTQRLEHTYYTFYLRFHFKRQSHDKSTIKVKHYTSGEQIVQCLDRSPVRFSFPYRGFTQLSMTKNFWERGFMSSQIDVMSNSRHNLYVAQITQTTLISYAGFLTVLYSTVNAL